MHPKVIIPPKLKKGSHIRVIAPSRGLGLLSDDVRDLAKSRLEQFGFRVSFSSNINEFDEFFSASVASRVADIHEAFIDPDVDGILTVIGGYNSNQLLEYIDYDLIKSNPKYLCGFSDITTLNNAVFSQTGVIGCNGPHFSSWGIQRGFDYSIEYFEKCCLQDRPFEIEPAKEWSDDAWYLDQQNREFIATDGFLAIQEGEAEGLIIGGHMRCLAALQGTRFWPGLDNSILLIEEDAEINPRVFDRLLQSLIHQKDFSGVRGIVIGRFQKNTEMSDELLKKIIANKPELRGIPIVANVTLGHTMPIATFPIGGTMILSVSGSNIKLTVTNH